MKLPNFTDRLVLCSFRLANKTCLEFYSSEHKRQISTLKMINLKTWQIFIFSINIFFLKPRPTSPKCISYLMVEIVFSALFFWNIFSRKDKSSASTYGHRPHQALLYFTKSSPPPIKHASMTKVLLQSVSPHPAQ